jgi:hypothetical protein
MPTPDGDLDATISDLEARFDSVLLSAKNVGKIYDERLKATTFELLGIEKKMAAKGGEPAKAFADTFGTLLGGTIAWGLTNDRSRFSTAWAGLSKEKQAAVRWVEDQERAVEGASPEVLWRSMEKYLQERLDPAHFLIHVQFKFQESVQILRDAAGNLKSARVRVVKWGPSAG